MIKKSCTDLLAVGSALAVLLPLSPAVAGRARPHHHVVRTSGTMRYPTFWPRRIPVRVGDARRYPLVTTYLKGPEYWHTLPPATRARLDTFGRLQYYCQKHEGAWPL
jgi:hypothetical protein